MALVGPTGVGKTTTVAKLAASFKLVQRLRVGLVTVDTYRIAAVEQLKTYADIIDLPLDGGQRSRRDAVRRSTSWVPWTSSSSTPPGRSPRDEVKIRELEAFMAEARPDEVHLVLSAGAGERTLRSAVERFAQVGADRLILTKLDEAQSLGAVLGVLGQASLPVSYFTTGQAVPGRHRGCGPQDGWPGWSWDWRRSGEARRFPADRRCDVRPGGSLATARPRPTEHGASWPWRRIRRSVRSLARSRIWSLLSAGAWKPARRRDFSLGFWAARAARWILSHVGR